MLAALQLDGPRLVKARVGQAASGGDFKEIIVQGICSEEKAE
jgi:hypothetical protein